MLAAIKRIGIIIITCSLSACGAFYSNGSPNYSTYNDHATELYPEGYENVGNYTDTSAGTNQVSVPESPHVSAYHPPTRPKDVDHQWVSSQNASDYTIEIAESDKAYSVASSLQKAPSTERKAEVKYQSGERTLYKGVYGTYPTREAAQQALQSLPADIQSDARIKSWSSIQGAVGD